MTVTHELELSEADLLDVETKAARTRLAGLHRDIAMVQQQLGTLDPARILQINDRLVLAALSAEDIASDALVDLQRLRQENRQQGERLRTANEQLVLKDQQAREHDAGADEARRRQVRFLATVAHELRNPLAPIRTATQLLSRAEREPAMLGRIAGIIERQVAHMARLIEDLLDAARADAGGFRLDLAEIDLLLVLEQALEAARPLVEARGQVLNVRLPAGPVNVRGDVTRLAQVFCNLLDNACKYTPHGGRIELDMHVGSDAVDVAVSDNGIGISATGLPRVFEMFGQEARAKEVDAAGLGIGLAVVHGLVEAHGGSIVALSDGEHRGSRFVVSLPLHTPAPA